MFVEVVVTIGGVLLFIPVAVAMPIAAGLLCLRVWQRLLSTMTSPATDNRILYWPVVLTILWPLLLAVLWLFFEMSGLLSFVSGNFAIITLVSLWFVLVAGLGLVAMWVGSVAVACKLMVQWALARHCRLRSARSGFLA